MKTTEERKGRVETYEMSLSKQLVAGRSERFSVEGMPDVVCRFVELRSNLPEPGLIFIQGISVAQYQTVTARAQMAADGDVPGIDAHMYYYHEGTRTWGARIHFPVITPSSKLRMDCLYTGKIPRDVVPTIGKEKRLYFSLLFRGVYYAEPWGKSPDDSDRPMTLDDLLPPFEESYPREP